MSLNTAGAFGKVCQPKLRGRMWLSWQSTGQLQIYFSLKSLFFLDTSVLEETSSCKFLKRHEQNLRVKNTVKSN